MGNVTKKSGQKPSIKRFKGEQTRGKVEPGDLFSTIVDKGNDGITIIQEGLIKFVNPKMEALTGYRADELIGRSFLDFISPEYKELVSGRYKKRLRGEDVPARYEFEILTKRGIKLPIEVNSSIIKYNGSRATMGILRDLTKRKQTESALKKSEEKYRSLIETSSDLIFITERKSGKILEINEASCDKLGYSRDEILGTHSGDRVVPEQREAYRREFERLKKTGRYSGEFDVRRKDGSIITMSVSGAAFGDYLYAIGRDVTERSKAEMALKESEEKFRKYVESSPTSVFIVDEKGNYKFVNDAATKQTGFTEEELLRMSIPQLVHPDAFEKGVSTFPELQKKGKVKAEIVLRHKDGSRIYVILDAVKISDTRFLGHTTDITARKKAEEALQKGEHKYRTLVEANPHGIHEINKAGIITYTNPAYQRILGYTGQELLGMSILDLLEPEAKREELREYLPTLVRKRPQPTTYYQKNRTKDGRIIDMEVDWNYKLDSEGRVVGFTSIITNVTERSKAEAALKESEEKLRTITDFALDGIVMMNEKGKVVYWNPAAEGMFGYSGEEILGKNMHKMLATPKQRKTIFEKFNKFTKTGRGNILGRTFETEALRKNGEEFPVEISVSGIKIKDQWWSVGLIKNITKRKAIEEALRRSEENYHTIFDTVNEIIFIHDIKTGKIIDVNKKMCETFGYTRKEALGLSIDAISSGESSNIPKESFKRLIKEAKSEAQTLEWICKNRVGRFFWMEVNLKPVVLEGKKRILTVMTDITARKEAEESLRQSEERYRSLVETSPDAITLTDLTGKLIMANSQAALLYGFKSVKEMLSSGKTAFDFMAPEDGQRVLKNLKRTIEVGSIRNAEYTLLRNDGKTIPAEFSASLLTDAMDSPKGFIGLIRDISDRKRAEKELEKAYSELEARVKERTLELLTTNKELHRIISECELTQEALSESEKKFKGLAEESPNMIFINKGGRIVYANKRCEEVMGYSREEFYSSDFNFMDLISPASRKLVKENFEKHNRGEDVPPNEYSIMSKEGKEINSIIKGYTSGE
jgi:PAS domain S-box-containing protein